MSQAREVEFTQDEFDEIWETLLFCRNLILDGHVTMNSHLGHGEASDEKTREKAKSLLKLTGRMADLVSSGEEDITLRVIDK